MLRKQSPWIFVFLNNSLVKIVVTGRRLGTEKFCKSNPLFDRLPEPSMLVCICLASVSCVLHVRPGLSLHYLLLAPLVPSVQSPLKVSAPA